MTNDFLAFAPLSAGADDVQPADAAVAVPGPVVPTEVAAFHDEDAALDVAALIDADLDGTLPLPDAEAADGDLPETLAALDLAGLPEALELLDPSVLLATPALPDTPAMLDSLAVLDDLMARVGVDGLSAAFADPGLLARVDQEATVVRESLRSAGRVLDSCALASYARSILAAAERMGRPVPEAGGADHSVAGWHTADWHQFRLVAVCAIAESSGLL